MVETAKSVLAALSRSGLLLQQDKTLPNVVTLVTGDTLSTSWWSHPKGKLVFTVLSELDDHEDVLFVKLLHAKVTLVHRRLWPALLSVVSEREAWQLGRLSPAAGALLASIDEMQKPVMASGAAVKALEVRLPVGIVGAPGEGETTAVHYGRKGTVGGRRCEDRSRT